MFSDIWDVNELKSRKLERSVDIVNDSFHLWKVKKVCYVFLSIVKYCTYIFFFSFEIGNIGHVDVHIFVTYSNQNALSFTALKNLWPQFSVVDGGVDREWLYFSIARSRLSLDMGLSR